jgi:hypothetical protein
MLYNKKNNESGYGLVIVLIVVAIVLYLAYEVAQKFAILNIGKVVAVLPQ